MKCYVLLLVLFAGINQLSFAQAIPDTTTQRQTFFVEVGAIVASARQTPFWLRSRQYGTVPLNAPAGIVRFGGVTHIGDRTNPRKLHLKLGFEGVGNAVAPSGSLLLPEGYASLRLGQFEIYAGRRREVFGLGDTLLSSGSYAWSGNALPIPKIQIGTRGFVPIGFTNGVLAINALYAHGWFANTDSIQGSFLHQKSVYARLSLFRRHVQFYAGFNHFVQWGGRSTAPGTPTKNGVIPSSLRDYWFAVTAQRTLQDSTAYTDFDLVNVVGNHLGTIDAALELSGKRANWFFYMQHPFEDRSGVAFQNMPDGLYGIRWRNMAPVAGENFQLMQVTAEILSTVNQSGFNIDIGNRLYDGADDYFNNYQFVDGWTQQQRVIGTPFLTRWLDTRPELRNLKGGFGRMMISNSRVQVLHIGLLGGWANGAQIKVLLSRSNNVGRPVTADPRLPVSQFSGMAEIMTSVSWLGNSQLRLAVAIDEGKLLPNSVGGWFSVRKTLNSSK